MVLGRESVRSAKDLQFENVGFLAASILPTYYKSSLPNRFRLVNDKNPNRK
jgi:hypothetical protein